MAIFITVGL